MIDPKCGACFHFWFRQGDCTGAAETCEDYNRDMSTDQKVDKRPRVKTKLGTFVIARKGAVAISVVKTKHSVRHHGSVFGEGAVTHIEHRKPPKHPGSDTGWYIWVATFGLDGKELARKKAVKSSKRT